MEFIIITLAVFLGMMASYAMMLALLLNKTAMNYMTKKILKNTIEIHNKLDEDEELI